MSQSLSASLAHRIRAEIRIAFRFQLFHSLAKPVSFLFVLSNSRVHLCFALSFRFSNQSAFRPLLYSYPSRRRSSPKRINRCCLELLAFPPFAVRLAALSFILRAAQVAPARILAFAPWSVGNPSPQQEHHSSRAFDCRSLLPWVLPFV